MKWLSVSRFTFLGGLLTLFSLLIISRMIAIQTGPVAEELNNWAKSQSYERRIVYPERGKIYDRWGHLLAGNKIVYELGLELRQHRNPQSIALTLSSILPSLKYEEVLAAAAMPYDPAKSAYITLSQFVDEETKQKIETLKNEYDQVNPGGKNPNLPSLNGVVWTPKLIRFYPEGKLAANVLGFYTYANIGQETGAQGVEGYYNTLLAGRPKEMVLPFDPYEMQALPDIPPGADLILTIDREMQAAVEKILDRAMEKNGAKSGTVIVYQPETGEILAMATNPRIDPNRYGSELTTVLPKNMAYNNAVSTVYEPGSVFKVLTMAAAIDAGVVTPDTTFIDTGGYSYGGYVFRNWNQGAWGEQTMTGCMQHSLNVCLTWVAVEKLGKGKFYEYMEAFGIGHRTNIDLALEGQFPFSTPLDSNTWQSVNLATNSFGQGVAVTPIQMVQAIGAIANDGKMMWPHVVKGYIQDGRQINIDPLVVGTPVSAETARTITKMLTITLEEESFSNASVPGYSVAGKTGTAQIPGEDGYYLPNATNASFVGWGPSDDPKFLVYIWFEQPKADSWGSTIAAPVFPPIFKELVRIGNIPPDDIRSQLSGR